jgi:tRNA-dihydrouridine synthase A
VQANHPPSPWRLCIAPMMDWTDRHCRVFHRQFSRHTRLYTEMVTTGALLHGDLARHLDFDTTEHPLALQLGGSEPADLARCARLGAQWGYDEINLNCGCPSERVQRGAFGACLMAEPGLVRDCVKAMVDAVALPVTVKHRIGLERGESHAFVRDFIGTVAEGGCTVFIVHARNAWLKGLSPAAGPPQGGLAPQATGGRRLTPKENREVPPLRHGVVHQLKRDFPHLTIVLNGGVSDDAQIAAHLAHVDGVMLGREAYHHPWLLTGWDARFFGDAASASAERETVEAAMVDYMAREQRRGVAWPQVARHMMGLWHGTPGARRWRQVWSDHRLKTESPAHVSRLANQARRAALADADEPEVAC